jgi:hypothetical protein
MAPDYALIETVVTWACNEGDVRRDNKIPDRKDQA